MRISPRAILLNLLGSAVMAFGLCHVHAYSGVTEGGILGLTLLLDHWLHISPSLSSAVMTGACYLFGWRVMGRLFLLYSLLDCVFFSISYALFEQLDPAFPWLAGYPLAAAILGALFIGVGVGLCVRAGGAPTGDDSLAMALNRLFGWPLTHVYLVSDLTVLLLSLSYLPLRNIACSLLTVVLSGQIIGLIQKYPPQKNKSGAK